MKKFFSIVIISIMLFSLAGFAFAQDRELEIEYPEIKGEQPEEVTTSVPKYVKYIFNFLILISGLIALIVLIYAGFEYFTSAGSPERINDAKSRIGAALLGLLILFGSYLILTTINPELIVFRLPRLKPIISELAPGVLVCKEEAEVDRAWQLSNNFKYAEEYWEQEMIAEELEQIFEDISDKCYVIIATGDIRSDFDDKITDIYLIPGEQTIDEERYLALYGIILYEDKNYEGKSQIIYEHLKDIGGVTYPEHIQPEPGLSPSSIKPFVLIPKHHEERFQVVLYQKPNQNQGTDFVARVYRLDPGNWYWMFDLTAAPNFIYDGDFHSPESIKVGGDFIAILVTKDGRSNAFYNEIDHNLLDNYNIVNWVECKEWVSTVFGGSWRTTTCAEAAAIELVIISAKPY